MKKLDIPELAEKIPESKSWKDPIKEIGDIYEKAKQAESYLDQLKRLQAEFDNYKKYIENQRKITVKQAQRDLMAQLLEVIDSFDAALKHCNEEEASIKGTKQIFEQLWHILQKNGLKKIETNGKEYDHNQHEVVTIIKSEEKEGIILEEVQKGYVLYDKVLRYAKVIVAGQKKDNPKEVKNGKDNRY